MSLLVAKFGGTSVANTARLQEVARKIKQMLNRHDRVVVVTSAMAGATNQLLQQCKDINGGTVAAEATDMVLATGEQVNVGLLTLALHQAGVPAKGLMSWEVPIQTNNTISNARIESINTECLRAHLEQAPVVVLPGFQGVTAERRLRTLGRGGSDTTAVAVAGALQVACHIYTDVKGIYSADPRMVPHAHVLADMQYSQAAAFAYNGAKVMHFKAIDEAVKRNVAVHVLSSFQEGEGTWIGPQSLGAQASYIGMTALGVQVLTFAFQQRAKISPTDIDAALKEMDILYDVLALKEDHLKVSVARQEVSEFTHYLQEAFGSVFQLEDKRSLAKFTFVKGSSKTGAAPALSRGGVYHMDTIHASHYWVNGSADDDRIHNQLYHEVVMKDAHISEMV